MGWYLRKSVKLGPIRFNLSKSGVGASTGIPGFRVGVRPNGQSYIHAGRHGIYYRKNLSGGRTPARDQSGTTASHASATGGQAQTTHYATATSQQLVPHSRKDMLDRLNQSYTSFRLDYACAIAGLLLTLAAFRGHVALGWTVLVGVIAATVIVARWETRRRTVALEYDLEDNGRKFQQLLAGTNALSESKRIWSMLTSRSINNLHDWKRNAGASNIVSRTAAKIGAGSPPWVETNIDVCSIKTRGQTLYFMPDGILVYDRKGVGFVEYGDLQVQTDTTRFIEDSPPPDAQVVDTTWQHPNKSGGPDRRFKDNRQIPVCLYGQLRMRTNSGLDVFLMTSRHDGPEGFHRGIHASLR
jgi:hypothetical protein